MLKDAIVDVDWLVELLVLFSRVLLFRDIFTGKERFRYYFRLKNPLGCKCGLGRRDLCMADDENNSVKRIEVGFSCKVLRRARRLRWRSGIVHKSGGPTAICMWYCIGRRHRRLLLRGGCRVAGAGREQEKKAAEQKEGG